MGFWLTALKATALLSLTIEFTFVKGNSQSEIPLTLTDTSDEVPNNITVEDLLDQVSIAMPHYAPYGHIT